MYRRDEPSTDQEAPSDGPTSGRDVPERRNGQDRRSGLDRRGPSGVSLTDPEPRPYGFRQFSERRARQERRLFHRDDDGTPGGRGFRRGRPGYEGGEIFVRLTRDELRVLLESVGRASKYDRFS